MTCSFVFLSILVVSTTQANAPAHFAFHDDTGTFYQDMWNRMAPVGYRPISITMHGTTANPRYGAVWAPRDGPLFTGVHGATLAECEAFVDKWALDGYVPYLVAGTGSGTNRRFSVVLEQRHVSYVFKAGISQLEFISTNNSLRAADYRLLDVDQLGPTLAPEYIAVWVRDGNVDGWNVSVNLPSADHQEHFNAFGQQWARPAKISVGPWQYYTGLWRDDVLPQGWTAFHNLTSAQYVAESITQYDAGRMPIMINGGGSGTSRRFAAVFATTEIPMEREWTVTGQQHPTLGAFDTRMREFMEQHGVRGGGLAITRNCQIVLARGYTWAEPGYPTTQPTSMFRNASVSKPITAIGAMRRIEQDQGLTMDTFIKPYLNLQPPPNAGSPSPRLDEVRVWHLLSHAGGWNTELLGFDPMFRDLAVAQALGVPFPVTRYHIRDYMYDKPMHTSVGCCPRYSNYGFSLLGQVLEQSSGLTYTEYMRNHVFGAMFILRPNVGRTLRGQEYPGEVRYHSSNLGISMSVMEGHRPLVPVQYGGYNVENFDAHGGWVMAPADMCKLMTIFDNHGAPLMSQASLETMLEAPLNDHPTTLRGWYLTTTAGRTAYEHNGWIRGTSAMAYWRTDGFGVAISFNRDTPALNAGSTIGLSVSQTINGIPANSWPDWDLSGELGLLPCPTFTPTPTNTPRDTFTPSHTHTATHTPTSTHTPSPTNTPLVHWRAAIEVTCQGPLSGRSLWQLHVFPGAGIEPPNCDPSDASSPFFSCSLDCSDCGGVPCAASALCVAQTLADCINTNGVAPVWAAVHQGANEVWLEIMSLVPLDLAISGMELDLPAGKWLQLTKDCPVNNLCNGVPGDERDPHTGGIGLRIPSGPFHTPTPGPQQFVWGDVDDNGVAGTVDASLILQWDAFLISQFPCCPEVWPDSPLRGDVNADGVLGTVDASMLLQFDAFLLDCFPADLNCDGLGPD